MASASCTSGGYCWDFGERWMDRTGRGLTSGIPPYREAGFATAAVEAHELSDGSIILRSPIELGAYARSIHDYLVHWSVEAPDRLYLATVNDKQGIHGLTYRETYARVRRLGQALLDRGLNEERPVAVLSSNSIEHALVTLACMAVGVPVAPLSPNYGLLSGGEVRLSEIAAVLRPGLIFAQNARALQRLRAIPGLDRPEWISVDPAPNCTVFEDLQRSEAGPRYDTAAAGVHGDTIAKFLFTSGSTGSPKGVINTQRMLCSSVVMSGLLMKSMEAPVQVEWMPWHHTMGGNAQFNAVLKNGGTFVIDEGRPTPGAFERTIATLKAVSPTSLQTVPAGFAMLVAALRRDDQLRRSFFSRLRRISYGGAALPDGLIEALQDQALRTVGERIAVVSGYGTTETAPGICITNWPSEVSGEIGLPMPGVELKLLPIGDRYEIRVKGPNVTPGYLRRPDLTAEAFDEEGFYRVGDAVTFMDPNRKERGLRFAGRLSENFKLTTGTWVLAGDLRLALLNATTPALQDIVIAGENRDSVAILAWPNPLVPETLLAEPASRSDLSKLVQDQGLLRFIKNALERHNVGQGTSYRVTAFCLCTEPPSLADGEITDKAYINQRAVLHRRRVQVSSLFTLPVPEGVVKLDDAPL